MHHTDFLKLLAVLSESGGEEDPSCSGRAVLNEAGGGEGVACLQLCPQVSLPAGLYHRERGLTTKLFTTQKNIHQNREILYMVRILFLSYIVL